MPRCTGVSSAWQTSESAGTGRPRCIGKTVGRSGSRACPPQPTRIQPSATQPEGPQARTVDGAIGRGAWNVVHVMPPSIVSYPTWVRAKLTPVAPRHEWRAELADERTESHVTARIDLRADDRAFAREPTRVDARRTLLEPPLPDGTREEASRGRRRLAHPHRDRLGRAVPLRDDEPRARGPGCIREHDAPLGVHERRRPRSVGPVRLAPRVGREPGRSRRFPPRRSSPSWPGRHTSLERATIRSPRPARPSASRTCAAAGAARATRRTRRARWVPKRLHR